MLRRVVQGICGCTALTWVGFTCYRGFLKGPPLACDYAVDGSVSKSHCSDGKLRVIHQSLPQLVAGAVLTAPVVTIRMTTLDYPSEDALKVEAFKVLYNWNGEPKKEVFLIRSTTGNYYKKLN